MLVWSDLSKILIIKMFEMPMNKQENASDAVTYTIDLEGEM